MLPHSSILALPPTQKHRRRTIQVSSPQNDPHHRRYQVYIRELTIAEAGLGCAVWDAAILVARYAHHCQVTQQLWSNKTCMELGSGVGLPGLVLGRYAHRMILTDYEESLIKNLSQL